MNVPEALFLIINLVCSIAIGISCGFFFCYLFRRYFSPDIILEFIEKIKITKLISFGVAFIFVLSSCFTINILYKKAVFLTFPKILLDLSVAINGLAFYLTFEWIVSNYLLKNKKGERE